VHTNPARRDAGNAGNAGTRHRRQRVEGVHRFTDIAHEVEFGGQDRQTELARFDQGQAERFAE